YEADFPAGRPMPEPLAFVTSRTQSPGWGIVEDSGRVPPGYIVVRNQPGQLPTAEAPRVAAGSMIISGYNTAGQFRQQTMMLPLMPTLGYQSQMAPRESRTVSNPIAVAISRIGPENVPRNVVVSGAVPTRTTHVNGNFFAGPSYVTSQGVVMVAPYVNSE